MSASKASIALCIIGIGAALLPVTLYIFYGKEYSTIKALELEILPGISIYLLSSFIGAILTIAGILWFIRSIRFEALPRRPVVIQRPPRQITMQREIKSEVKNVDELVKSIEKEIEVALHETEKLTAQESSEKMEIEKPTYEIKVVASSFDEVCPSCGALNPLGQKICQQCNSTIYEEDKNLPSCPVCGAPLKNPKRLSDNIYICNICFSELEIPEELSKKL